MIGHSEIAGGCVLVAALTTGDWRWLVAGILLAASLWLWLPRGVAAGRIQAGLAAALGATGLLLLWWAIPALPVLGEQAAFWCLTSLTISASVATIACRSPVYSAIWFALALLGTAGLMLIQGAQFLGLATVAVYAGAIVVTFLFVLMLAQPEGHALYDRISWGTMPTLVATATGVLFVMIVAISVSRTDSSRLREHSQQIAQIQNALAGELDQVTVRGLRYLPTVSSTDGIQLRVAIAVPPTAQAQFETQRSQLGERVRQRMIESGSGSTIPIDEVILTLEDVRSTDHMAQFGSQLFGRHLVAVQAAGTLLLAALVGAVAIAGRDTPTHRTELI